jgi:hypothetical protein
VFRVNVATSGTLGWMSNGLNSAQLVSRPVGLAISKLACASLSERRIDDKPTLRRYNRLGEVRQDEAVRPSMDPLPQYQATIDILIIKGNQVSPYSISL